MLSGSQPYFSARSRTWDNNVEMDDAEVDQHAETPNDDEESDNMGALWELGQSRTIG